MEVELCQRCKVYPLIFSPLRFPIVYLGRVYCISCASNESNNYEGIQELPSKDKSHYESEQLTRTCKCVSEDNDKAGYYLDLSTFSVYCNKCNPNTQGLISLLKFPPRNILKEKISIFISDESMSPEIKKKLIRSSEMSVDEIVLWTRKYLCYYLNYPMCLIHVNYSISISLKSYQFKCLDCKNDEVVLDMNDSTKYTEVLDSALKSCKKVNTNAFNSIVLRYLKGSQNDWQTIFNFLYEMKELISSQNDDLKASSICLNCERHFSFKRLPITIHKAVKDEIGKHEICSECIKNNPNIVCPIDKLPLESPTCNYETFLYEFTDLTCNNCDSQNRFSISKKIFPLKAKCSHNICSECFRLGNGNICRACKEPIHIAQCVENTELTEKLKFTEIMCSTHNEQIMKFTFSEKTGLIGACKRCSNFHGCTKTMIFFVTKLKELLNEMKTDKTLKLNRLLENIDFLPLSYRYFLLKMKENEIKDVLIADEIIPKSNNDINWWYEKGTTYDLFIKSNHKMFMYGILLGNNSRNSLAGLEITLNGRLISQAQEALEAQKNEISRIYFNEPILISSTGFYIKLTLPKGKYYQIPRATEPRNKIALDYNAFIEFYFTTRKTGDMNLGGPFCGFCCENFYWIDSYFGENSHL